MWGRGIVQTTWLMEKRKMPNSLEHFSTIRWKSGTHHTVIMIVFSLMEQQMSKSWRDIVRKLPQSIMLSRWRACDVPVFQGPVKPKAHSGEEIFLIFHEIQSNTSSATCFMHMSDLQHFWEWCKSFHPCAIYCTGKHT